MIEGVYETLNNIQELSCPSLYQHFNADMKSGTVNDFQASCQLDPYAVRRVFGAMQSFVIGAAAVSDSLLPAPSSVDLGSILTGHAQVEMA